MKYWFAGLLISISTNILAEDVVVYRWVDENNVVHFTQNQPASGEYTEIMMASTSQAKKSKNTAVSNSPKDIANSGEEMDNISEENKALCEEAKTNLETLNSFDRVRIVDEKGESTILSKEQREEQITLNKKQVDFYCK